MVQRFDYTANNRFNENAVQKITDYERLQDGLSSQKNQFYLMLLDVSRGISVMDVTIMLCTYYGPIQISDLV